MRVDSIQSVLRGKLSLSKYPSWKRITEINWESQANFVAGCRLLVTGYLVLMVRSGVLKPATSNQKPVSAPEPPGAQPRAPTPN
jgi:hypothetical protein